MHIYEILTINMIFYEKIIFVCSKKLSELIKN